MIQGSLLLCFYSDVHIVHLPQLPPILYVCFLLLLDKGHDVLPLFVDDWKQGLLEILLGLQYFLFLWLCQFQMSKGNILPTSLELQYGCLEQRRRDIFCSKFKFYVAHYVI